MNVQDHWLKSTDPALKVVHAVSPHARNEIDPDYLIIHYTAGDTASSAINWFMDKKNNPDRIAAHIVIDLDGTITQLIPFNRRANHAGSSTWNGIENFNYHSIGIEIVNPGFCERLADNSYRRRVTNDRNQSYPKERAAEILETKHKHRHWTERDNNNWFKFPDQQLNSVYQVSSFLVKNYELVNALGHDDISPLRKPDPGPCFPWHEFKINVFGKSDNTGEIFTVNTDGTNFRVNHSTNSAIIRTLQKGYNVGLIETFGAWSKVYLAHERTDLLMNKRCIKIMGWIHSSLLSPKS